MAENARGGYRGLERVIIGVVVVILGIFTVVGRVVWGHHVSESFWKEWRTEKVDEEFMSRLDEFFDCRDC